MQPPATPPPTSVPRPGGAPRARRTTGYHAADLAEVPAVETLLDRIGIGSLTAGSLRSVAGRNDNWIGTTSTAAEVFVKRLHAGDREARMHRTLQVARAGAGRVAMPQVLGADAEEALLAFEFLPDARPLSELAVEEEIDEERCAEAGRQVAALHDLPPAGFDGTEHPLPPLGSLAGIPLAYFAQASAAELEMWRLIQADQPLVDALARLRETERAAHESRVPVHGDLRLDQFLVSAGRLHLSDFEETRLGDPARDLGAFAGEFLYLAAAALPTSLSAALPIGGSASHAQIVATGVDEIEQRAPFVRAFWRAYRATRPASYDDGGLAARATAYAGWHMVDRMLAGAANTHRLSAVSKAAAGIGRTLLMAPAEFASTLGLED